MRNYYANLTPQHQRSWLLVFAYTGALLVLSLVDFGYNGAGQTLFRGVLLGMLVFLVASGLSLIFGLLDVLNFAQGAFLLIGAYVGYDVYTSLDAGIGVRFLAAIVVSVLFVAVLGAIMETALIRPLYDRPIFQLVLTFGLGSVFLDLVERYYGPDPEAALSAARLPGRPLYPVRPELELLPPLYHLHRPRHHDRRLHPAQPHPHRDRHPRGCARPGNGPGVRH